MDPRLLTPYAHSLQGPFIASYFSLLLYGVTCVQTFFYFQTFPDDHPLLKYMVALIWILESAHSGFTISFNNSYLIDGFGVWISRIPWDLLVSLEIAFNVIFIVNLFFTWRVWMFSKKVWAACLLLFLVIARYVMVSVSTLLGFHYSTWESFKDHVYLPLAITMGVVALEDTLMALILAYYLHDKSVQSSTQMVTRLLAYAIGTGALTSVVAIMELISILASPNTLLFLLFVLINVKIYANSALLSLNLRQYHRNEWYSHFLIVALLLTIAQLGSLQVVESFPSSSQYFLSRK